MRGHVRQRGKGGLWSYSVDIGRDPVTNKRRQETKSGFRTKRECEAAMNLTITKLGQGDHVQHSTRTVGEFLTGDWLPSMEGRVRPGTYALHEANVRVHLVPHLGAIKLQSLTAARCDRLYAELRRRPNGALRADKTILNVHVTLRRALKDAVDWNLLANNPADKAHPPRGEGQKPTPWSPAELRAFLAAPSTRDDRLYAAWLLAATTGMRRGELLALQWGDIDLENGVIPVRKARVVYSHQWRVGDPKTKKGYRDVPIGPVTVAALRAHRKRQAEEQLAARQWQGTGYLFVEPDGRPIHPREFTRRFQKACRRAGVRAVRLHDVRHMAGTQALETGEDDKYVAERLGHDVATLRRTYQHTNTATHRALADRQEAALLGT